MRTIIFILLGFLLLFASPHVQASGISVSPNYTVKEPLPVSPVALQALLTLKRSEIEMMIGRRLKLKERIGLTLFKWQYKISRRKGNEGDMEKAVEKGRLSLIFGICALGSILMGALLPFLGIIGFGLAIAGLILGIQSRKIVKNRQNKTGIILNSIYLGLFVLAAIIAVLALTLLSIN